jgi:hypothetical protein
MSLTIKMKSIVEHLVSEFENSDIVGGKFESINHKLAKYMNSFRHIIGSLLEHKMEY